MFNYQIIGKGNPVVFIHGFLESSTMWNEFDLKNAGFKSILIDLPGHGKSALTKKYKSLIEIAEELTLFLEKQAIYDFDLIGHSLGGYVALEMHKLKKSKNKLILFHSNFWEDDSQKKIDRNRVIEVVRKQKYFFLKEAIPNLFLSEFRGTSLVEDLILEAKNISEESIIIYSELMRDRLSNENYVKKIRDKILFIQGQNDHIVPIEMILSFQDTLNVAITSAGHMGHIEATEEEFTLISNYLEMPIE